jgi:HSP20 family protein
MTRDILSQWDQVQRRLLSFAGSPYGTRASACWSPNTDVYEEPDGVTVRLELAGLAREDVDVTVRDSLLIVRGVRTDPGEAAAADCKPRCRQLEIESGPFERIVRLPFPVDSSGTHATMMDGILEIRLPKSGQTGPRTIRIQPKGAS